MYIGLIYIAAPCRFGYGRFVILIVHGVTGKAYAELSGLHVSCKK